MEAKQLMIGDWISQDGKPRRYMAADWVYVSKYTPIALSPEILENNDFWSENNVWSWWDDEHTQSVDIYWNYDIAHVEAENNLHTHIETNITDVHELQHILRMAGINLEIKL